MKQLEPDGWGAYLAALAVLVEASDREVIWLPFHQEQDRGLLQLLHQADMVPRSVALRSREVEVEEPTEAMALFARAGLVLAMRLHGLILAALAGSPVAALSYDPKVAVAARAIGCPLQDLEAPPDPRLADRWGQHLDQPPSAAAIETLRRDTTVHEELLRRTLVG
jgi:polysaccharide pyruvyl transferase WcaK-like protein